jgi:hypothetical protein
MQLDLLTVPILKEIARRHGLPTQGTKADLITRLQAVTMPTAAAVWLLYTEERLDQFIAALGLDASQALDKQQKAATLAAIPDLTPTNALTAHLAHQQGSKVDLQLAKQTATERPEAFIDRATIHFQLVGATDTEAVTLLVNAAQPNIASFLTQSIQAGTTTKAELLQLVLNRFAPNCYQYHHQFRSLKMAPGQTAQEAGNELRRLFLGFLGLNKDQQQTHEPVIRATVTAQLLDILPTPTAITIRTELLKEPGKPWEDILKLADQILQVSPKPHKPATFDVGQRTSRNQLHCSLHGYAGHADSNCNVQRLQREQAHKLNQARGPTSSFKGPTCFTCGKEGHVATNCPSTRPQPQGNC